MKYLKMPRCDRDCCSLGLHIVDQVWEGCKREKAESRMSGRLTLIVEGVHKQIRKAVRERRGWASCWGQGADKQNGRHLQYSGLGVPHHVVGAVPLVRVDTGAGKVVHNKMLVVVLERESMARNVHRDFWRARTVWIAAVAIHVVAPH